MARFNVFLDTNIFLRAKYNFAGGSLYSLKKLCDKDIVTLLTNDIVLREVRHHIERDIGQMAKQAKNSIKSCRELINAISQETYITIEETLLSASNQLASAFETYMSGSTVLRNDGLSVVELFNDYFANTAPFENRESKKSEFPDAAIIMSIKRYIAETNNSAVYVVTDDDGWHNALKGYEGVCLYRDLKTLLTEINRCEEEEIFVQIAQYMGENLQVMQNSIERWFYDQDWSSTVDNIEMCIECDEIDDLFVSAVKLSPNGIEYIDKDNLRAVASFSGIATVDLEFSYIDHAHEIYDREDHVWLNTLYGNGHVRISMPFSGSQTISISEEAYYKFDSPDFDEIDLGTIEIVDCELTPYRQDDDPFWGTCPDCGNPIGIHNDGGNGFCISCAPRH